ncbi:MAG: DUF6882 domain-containing protein [Nitrospirota bacterium]
MNKLISYFEKIALVTLEKQNGLIIRLGEHILELDHDRGMARFNADIAYPFQLLGTESDNSLTWLWAWADEQPEVSEGLLRSARELKAWGAREGVTEFTTPAVDLNRADGSILSLIATGVCAASGYYRDPYDGGTLFILLYGADNGQPPVFDRMGLVHALSDLVSRYDFDHRNTLLSYFTMKNLPFSDTGDTVNAELAGGERFVAMFDRAGRVITINGKSLS